MPTSESLQLKFGLSFADLYRREGLVRIDAAFVEIALQQHLGHRRATYVPGTDRQNLDGR